MFGDESIKKAHQHILLENAVEKQLQPSRKPVKVINKSCIEKKLIANKHENFQIME